LVKINHVRPLQKAAFCSISASCSNFNPQNLIYIPVVDPPEADRLFELKQIGTRLRKLPFFKSLRVPILLAIIMILLFFCGCSHDVSFYRKTGDVYYKNGAYSKAEAEYKEVLKHYPKDSDAHFRLGVIYYKTGLIEKSLLEFIEVTRIDPKYGKAYYNLGTIFSSGGPYFDAKKATFSFKKYLELEPATNHRAKIERWLSKYGTK
jgi:tetratricopeptide (TPR) repeat protein